MRMKLLTLIASAFLFSPLPALAQIGQSAALTGTVTDATGAILPRHSNGGQRIAHRRQPFDTDRCERRVSFPGVAAGLTR